MKIHYQSMGGVVSCSLLFLLFFFLTAAAAGDGTAVMGARIKISTLVESDADPGMELSGDRESLQLDVKPWLLYLPTTHWSAYAKAQLFTSTSATRLESDEGDFIAWGFVGLRELWVDYNALTPYPGESLRIGRQRLRTRDALLLDTDIEAVRWHLDTTLVSSNLLAAQRFATWRSDSADLEPDQEDRLNLFGDLSWQWHPGHRLGGFLMYQHDGDDLPAVGSVLASDSRETRHDLLWYGLRLRSDANDAASRQSPFSYWLTGMGLTGRRHDLLPEQGMAAGSEARDVSAWAVDVGGSWQLPFTLPVHLGAAWALATGGGDDDQSNIFIPSGLGSNRSRFAGTRSRLYRFGDYLRPEFSNLQVATLFATMGLTERWEGVLLYEDVRLDDPDEPLGTDMLPGTVVTGRRDVGQEVDLCVTRYLDSLQWRSLKGRGYLRLRSSLFLAGEAYGEDEDSLFYRVTLDFFVSF